MRKICDDNYWEAICPNCFWQGSTKDCDGFGSLADTGDYDDGYCPKCGTSIEELDSKTYLLRYIILHYTIGFILVKYNIWRIDRMNKRWIKHLDEKAKAEGWYE